ncbi:MAG TPA: hypothetical protein VFS14_04240 [Candidatus Saccharimonadales bacterium]|nr:hypothetical protein [Candidatus Saccharimonadales bacterium]
MKKAKLIMLSVLAMAAALSALVGTTYAGNFQSGDTVITKKNEVFDRTLFAAGKNVEINGTVKGDVFCAGQNITVNATVEGDVICAGMNVEIRGTVAGDVRAAGQVVTLDARVGHNASLVGSSVKIEHGASVAKDVQLAGSTLTVDGTVGRDADAAGSLVAIRGMVGGDVQATTENLRLGSGAKVNGDITYYSHNSVDKSSDAKVAGTLTRKDPPKGAERPTPNPVPGAIFSFFALLSLAFVALAVFPRKLRELSDLALTQPGMTALIGLAACIGAPAVILVSFMTLVGVWVGLALLLIWAVVLLLSSVFASYYLGRLILARSAPHHPFVAMLAGVAVISLLLMIPVVNFITLVAIMIMGSGMVVREVFTKNPAPRYETVTHPQRKKPAKA